MEEEEEEEERNRHGDWSSGGKPRYRGKEWKGSGERKNRQMTQDMEKNGQTER